MINKILVALDGSKHSNKALDFALDLASKYSANVTLLTVISPTPALAHTTEEILDKEIQRFTRIYEEMKTIHEKVLSEALKKAKKVRPNLKISTKLVEGRPADQIVKIADEGNFNIVVMGSRGIGGIKEIFLGSVSDRVADEIACPVLIVK